MVNSCSLDSNPDTSSQSFRSLWHLINVSGGIAGVNDSFSLETIVWSFNEDTFILTIENNNTDDTKQDGHDSGEYDYSIVTENNEEFIVLDGTEIGAIYLTSQNILVIDENVTSSGAGADGFLYTFQRTLVAE